MKRPTGSIQIAGSCGVGKRPKRPDPEVTIAYDYGYGVGELKDNSAPSEKRKNC